MLLAAPDPELFDRARWFAATPTRREQIARAVADQLTADFEYVGLRNYAGTDLEIAVLRHRATELLFSLVPGGSFEMGMSPEEEQAIVDARPDDDDDADRDDFNQEYDLLLSEMGTMRPLHTVRLPPFLIAQRPLNVAQARRFIDDFSDPLYGHTSDAPAHLSNEQGSLVLIGTDLRLPSEAELEYAARGHLSRTLLPTSTRIPDEDLLESMLADNGDTTSNAFGIHGYGLYPERCADAWLEHYKGAPADGSPRLGPGPRVVRGGAANCYPWQGCGEWNVMLCAFRMSDHAAEFGSTLRLARSLASLPQDQQLTPSTPTKKTSSKKTAAKKTTAKKTTTKSPSKQAAKTTGQKAAKTTGQKAAKTTTTKAAAKKTTTKAAAKKVAKTNAAKKTTTNAAAKKTTTKAAAKKVAKTNAAAKKVAKTNAAKKTTTNAAAKKVAKTNAAAKKTTTNAAAKKVAKTNASSKKASSKKTTTKASSRRAPA
jgi:formylglycine-generating enzyme required for sulfatase activity